MKFFQQSIFLSFLILTLVTFSSYAQSNTSLDNTVFDFGTGLNAATTGTNLSALGVGALNSNSSGNENSGVGFNALNANLTGNFNTACGVRALEANTSGSLNSAFGRDALLNNNGSNNVAIGNRTMKNNTTGGKNTAIGNYSMEGNLTGDYNAAIGFESLRLSKTGSYNIAIGYRAIYNNDGGEYNTAIGYGVLNANVTGTNITAIGRGANVTMPNLINATAIGSNAKVAANSSIRFGNASIVNIEGQVNFTAVSDRKFKTNIKKSTLGLEFITQLNPVTYYMKKHGNKLYTGFIAQEVEQVTKDLQVEFSGLKSPANETDHYGLRYAEFTVPLVKATQEQQQIIERQESRIEDLELKNDELQTELEEVKSTLNRIEKLLFQESTATQNLELTLQGNSKQAELIQNIPNPFVSNTQIKAYIPKEVQNAKLMITDINGKVLLEKTIVERGAINTTVNAKNLAQGNYIYTLIIDGETLASKTMVLTK